MAAAKPYKRLGWSPVIIHVILRNQQLNAHWRGHYFGVYRRLKFLSISGLLHSYQLRNKWKKKKKKKPPGLSQSTSWYNTNSAHHQHCSFALIGRDSNVKYGRKKSRRKRKHRLCTSGWAGLQNLVQRNPATIDHHPGSRARPRTISRVSVSTPESKILPRRPPRSMTFLPSVEMDDSKYQTLILFCKPCSWDTLPLFLAC